MQKISYFILTLLGPIFITEALKRIPMHEFDQVSFGHEMSTAPELHTLTGEEEYRLFLQEMENGTFSAQEELHHRSKRYVVYNTDTTMALALIVGLPLTIVLPTLSNVFGDFGLGNLNFFGRKRRSINPKNNRSNVINDSDYDILDDQDFIDGPEFQPTLSKLSAYFELVQVKKTSFFKKAIKTYNT